MKRFTNWLFKGFIIFFLVLTLVFAYLGVFHKDLILQWLGYIKTIVYGLGYWNYFIIFLFAFIESFPLIWVSVPGQLVLITVAWFLWIDSILLSWLFASLGALFWNYIWYLMWLKYWDNFFKKYWVWMWVWETDIKYIKKWMDKQWWLWVVFWKFHNLLRAFVPFIAWTSKMNNFSFALFNIIGSILRATSMVILWVFFVENAETILSNIWKIFMFILILVWIYIYFFKRKEFQIYWQEKNLEMEQIMNLKK
jgi:membrane-associated protein